MTSKKQIALYIPDLKFIGYKAYYSKLRQLVKNKYSIRIFFIGYCEDSEIAALKESNPDNYTFALVFSNRVDNYLQRGYQANKLIFLEKQVKPNYANIYINIKKIACDIADKLLAMHYSNIFFFVSAQLNSNAFVKYLEDDINKKIPYASITKKIVENQQINRIAISLFNNLLVPDVVITDSFLIAENLNIIKKRLYPNINMRIICPTSILNDKYLNFDFYEVDFDKIALLTYEFINDYRFEQVSAPLLGFGESKLEASKSIKILSTNNLFISDFKQVQHEFRSEFNCSIDLNLVSIDELFAILSSSDISFDYDLVVLPYLWKNRFKDNFKKIGYYDNLVNDENVLLYNCSKDLIVFRKDLVDKYNLIINYNDINNSLINILNEAKINDIYTFDAIPLYFKDSYSIGKTFASIYFLNDKTNLYNFYEGKGVNFKILESTFKELITLYNFKSKKIIESNHDKCEYFFKEDTLTAVIDHNSLSYFLNKYPEYESLIEVVPYTNMPINYTGLAISNNSNKVDLCLKLIGKLEKINKSNNDALPFKKYSSYLKSEYSLDIKRKKNTQINDFEVNFIIGTAIKNYINSFFNEEQVLEYIESHLEKLFKTSKK